jgi:hypothetical protein
MVRHTWGREGMNSLFTSLLLGGGLLLVGVAIHSTGLYVHDRERPSRHFPSTELYTYNLPQIIY